MAANVTYIPPKAAKPAILRVAAYCRVSSDSSDQLHSYARICFFVTESDLENIAQIILGIPGVVQIYSYIVMDMLKDQGHTVQKLKGLLMFRKKRQIFGAVPSPVCLDCDVGIEQRA